MRLASKMFVLLALAVTTVGAQPASSERKDPKIGKWIARVSPPARGTREYEDRGCGLVVSTRQGVNADGRPYFSQYAAKYDGLEYPRVVRGSQTASTISFRTVDDATVEFTLREDGKVTSHGTTTVSKDGKVLTVTTRRAGSPEPGSVEIYDRQ
jgi:hypothetical protein